LPLRGAVAVAIVARSAFASAARSANCCVPLWIPTNTTGGAVAPPAVVVKGGTPVGVTIILATSGRRPIWGLNLQVAGIPSSAGRLLSTANSPRHGYSRIRNCWAISATITTSPCSSVPSSPTTTSLGPSKASGPLSRTERYPNFSTALEKSGWPGC